MERLMRNRWILGTVLCAAVALPVTADQPMAGFSSFNDWLGSEAHGVRISADGRVTLAPSLRRVAQLPEGVVWASVSDGSGGAFLSAGTDGRLFHFVGGQVKPLAQVKGGIVFAMARLGQDLIVAPSGENKLFRVTPTGDVKPFADIEARLVWAMTAQGTDLYLAGGNEKGAVLLLAREGSSRKLAELSDETAFTSMTPDAQGGWYLGSHGHGLVLRYSGVQGGDRLETLMATGFEEVRALAVDNGSVYAGANNGLATKFAGGILEKREGYLADPSNTTKGALIRLDRDRVPEVLWQSAHSQVFALTVWNNQLLMGTGNRARIFSVPISSKSRDLDPFSALQDLGTAQATAFLHFGSDLLVVGSNPGELHVMSQAQATEGTLESRILRGAPLSDWGRAYWEVDTPPGTGVTLQYRGGSTETPDGTWSPWTPPLANGERPNLKPSRFAQFKLKLTSSRGGATPIVEGVRIHWASRNLAPQWEGVEVMPPGVVITRNAPPEDIGIERIPLDTQKLIPALGSMGSEKRSFRRGSQAFVFKVSDPNNDALSFSISLLPDKGAPIELENAWRDRFFTFDTFPVSDGKYRLQVTANDSPSQPFNLALQSTWRTPTFTVDHTPPVISEFTAIPEGEGLRVRFLARDEFSVLKDAAISADGDKWLQVAPEGRVFDARDERFDVLIPRNRVKGDRISVRVSDASNNDQTASITIGELKKR